MKKIVKLAVVLLIAGLAVVSCNKPNRIVGYWDLEGEGVHVFIDDNGNVYQSENGADVQIGLWSLGDGQILQMRDMQGNKLKVEWISDNAYLVDDGRFVRSNVKYNHKELARDKASKWLDRICHEADESKGKIDEATILRTVYFDNPNVVYVMEVTDDFASAFDLKEVEKGVKLNWKNPVPVLEFVRNCLKTLHGKVIYKYMIKGKEMTISFKPYKL